MNHARLISVLVVDDSALVRERLHRLLEEADSRCIVAEAGNVAAAARALQSFRPDVVVLDVNLPDGSGFDLLPGIKRLSPPCAVILLTHHEEPAIRQRGMSLGADHVFRKAFEFERVAVVMQRIASRLRSGDISKYTAANPTKGEQP